MGVSFDEDSHGNTIESAVAGDAPWTSCKLMGFSQLAGSNFANNTIITPSASSPEVCDPPRSVKLKPFNLLW